MKTATLRIVDRVLVLYYCADLRNPQEKEIVLRVSPRDLKPAAVLVEQDYILLWTDRGFIWCMTLPADRKNFAGTVGRYQLIENEGGTNIAPRGHDRFGYFFWTGGGCPQVREQIAFRGATLGEPVINALYGPDGLSVAVCPPGRKAKQGDIVYTGPFASSQMEKGAKNGFYWRLWAEGQKLWALNVHLQTEEAIIQCFDLPPEAPSIGGVLNACYRNDLQTHIRSGTGLPMLPDFPPK
ncbi:MAG TPA: hypothetical protein PLP17_02925 [Oligoflexia bacterium]|nr:hypothetical protein [Oligoflexia bacterium]